MKQFKSFLISILAVVVLNFLIGFLLGEPKIDAGIYMALIVIFSSSVWLLLLTFLSLVFFKITGLKRSLKSNIIALLSLFTIVSIGLILTQFLLTNQTDFFNNTVVYFLPTMLLFAVLSSYLEFKILK